jgi:hypothetical protein
MPMVSKALLDKFKTLYKEQYDVVLTDTEASSMATDLVNLMKVILRPEPTSTDSDNSQERRQCETVGTDQ